MKLQRLRPQNCDSSWSAVNTMQNAGAAKKALILLEPEAQHLINIKNKNASCTWDWEELANTRKAQTSA